MNQVVKNKKWRKKDEEKKKNSFPQWSKSEANYPKPNKYIETVTNMREWELNQYREIRNQNRPSNPFRQSTFFRKSTSGRVGGDVAALVTWARCHGWLPSRQWGGSEKYWGGGWGQKTRAVAILQKTVWSVASFKVVRHFDLGFCFHGFVHIPCLRVWGIGYSISLFLSCSMLLGIWCSKGYCSSYSHDTSIAHIASGSVLVYLALDMTRGFGYIASALDVCFPLVCQEYLRRKVFFSLSFFFFNLIHGSFSIIAFHLFVPSHTYDDNN